MSIELTILIAVIGSALTIYNVLYARQRNIRSDAVSEASHNAALMAKLESLTGIMYEIKSEVKDNRDELREFRERLIKVESIDIALHERMDRLEKEVSAQ